MENRYRSYLHRVVDSDAEGNNVVAFAVSTDTARTIAAALNQHHAETARLRDQAREVDHLKHEVRYLQSKIASVREALG